LLLRLVERRGHTVPKDELRRLWSHEMALSDMMLTRAIRIVRRALGADAVRWVENVRGYGYRFAATLHEVSRVEPDEQGVGRPGHDSGIYPAARGSIEFTIERRLGLASARWALTPRHLDVLRGLVHGHSNREIAQTLRCTLRTVEAHMTALLERCDAPSRLALVATFWIDL
jgi:DNA-binding CsgD family transcriptional regulator